MRDLLFVRLIISFVFTLFQHFRPEKLSSVPSGGLRLLVVPLFPYNPQLARRHGVSSGGFAPTFSFGQETSRRVGMAASSIEKRVQEIAERVAIEHGLELVHAEVAGPENKPIVRVFIDKPQGVTHDDCSEMSNYLGTVLDVEDFIHASYTLEVSSPGLERGLYKRSDYERFVGSQAKMKTRQPINGQRNFRGQLLGVDGNDVIFEDRTNGQVRVPLDTITKANLEVDVSHELRKVADR
jgi:ribosome maturation factor RimP